MSTGQPAMEVPPKQGQQVTLVAALARNGAIGLGGKMPWHLPGELRHFRETTLGKPVVMGRRTFESIGRALPGRQNIVVTRNPGFRAEGGETVPSLRDALTRAVGGEVMVIGGGQMYREALPLATRMVLTYVDCAPEADTWFPRWNPEEWFEIGRRRCPADSANAFGFEIVDYVRR